MRSLDIFTTLTPDERKLFIFNQLDILYKGYNNLLFVEDEIRALLMKVQETRDNFGGFKLIREIPCTDLETQVYVETHTIPR